MFCGKKIFCPLFTQGGPLALSRLSGGVFCSGGGGGGGGSLGPVQLTSQYLREGMFQQVNKISTEVVVSIKINSEKTTTEI